MVAGVRRILVVILVHGLHGREVRDLLAERPGVGRVAVGGVARVGAPAPRARRRRTRHLRRDVGGHLEHNTSAITNAFPFAFIGEADNINQCRHSSAKARQGSPAKHTRL